MNTAKRLIVSAGILATLLAPAAVHAAPAQSNSARICVAWRNQCIAYRYVFGIKYCTVHQFTCIRWL